MNVRYDDVVHAAEGMTPVCGNAMMPACAPEPTSDPVTCWECESIVS
jgi:hypothetical protein